MMSESINLYGTDGVIFRQFPTSDYSLTINGSFVLIHSRQTKAIVAIFPSTAFSSVEIEREE